MGEKIKKSDLLEMFKEANKPLEDRLNDIESRQTKLVGTPEPETKDFSDKKSKDVKFTAKRPRDGEVPEEEFSFMRYFRAMQRHDWTGAEYERFALDESEKKTLSWASGSAGGYWVAAEFLPQEFIDYYGAAQICRAAGCRVLPCTAAPVQIPKSTAGGTAYWVNQNADITASDQTPGQLTLSPKICAARTQLSQTLFRTSQGVAEDIIRRDLATVIGREVDNGVLEGTGSSYQPTGMANTASIGTVEAGHEAITVADLRDMEYSLLSNNVPMVKPAFLMNPRTWHNIQEIIKGSTANDFVFHVDRQPSEAVPRNIFGYPVFQSTAISITNTTTESATQANVFFADMNDVILAEWGGLEIAATDIGGNAWVQFAMEVRVVAQVDVGVRNAKSVCLLSDTTS